MNILYSFPAPSMVQRTFPEISLAIARASNEDPLFPAHPSGALATACFLVALAWEGSRLQKWATRGSRNMGLFQVRIPDGQKVSSSVVMLPVTGSFVAIDRMRESFRRTEGRAAVDRLTAFVAEAAGEDPAWPSARSAHTGRQVMILAERLLSRYLPKGERISVMLLPSREDG